MQANYTLLGVTYNSKYWVEVEHNGVTSSRVTFQTPGCTLPVDRTFRRCSYPPSESRVAATPTPPSSAAVTQPGFDNGICIVKLGFHYPSSRPEFTARELGYIFDTRQLGPSTRVMETGLYSYLSLIHI